MGFQKLVVIDGRGHLLGRLASVIAKELLSGQKIVVVRAEELEITGSLMRNKLKYSAFLQKRMNTNPRRGPFHHRAPNKILWRAVRGMLPHKTKRGNAALGRFKAVEGCPAPYDRKKKLVVPQAFRALKLKPGRDYTRVGTLSEHFGWKHSAAITKLEARRKAAGKLFVARRKALDKIKKTALASIKSEDLSQYGY